MSDPSLLNYVTAYGTRRSCDLSELITQVGQVNRYTLFYQLERLERAGVIYINGSIVSIKNPSIAEGV
jgi:hypothetical protein